MTFRPALSHESCSLKGFFEAFAAGWIYGYQDQIEKLGIPAVCWYMFANFGSIAVACAVWFGAEENQVWGGFVALFLVYIAGIVMTGLCLRIRMQREPDRWTWGSIWYEIAFGNVMDLREQLSQSVGFLPWIWAFMIKQFLPHVILILFVNLAQSENDEGPLFGNYGNYVSWPFQILGYGAVVFAGSLFLIGLFFPSLYDGLTLLDEKLILGHKYADQKEVEGGKMVDDEEEVPVEKALDDEAGVPEEVEEADA